jgi:HEAT repeat protein
LLGLLLLADGPGDAARMRELLHDARHPREQSQAALQLVRDPSPSAEEIVRKGLRQTEEADVFLALASAVRLNADRRFTDELIEALAAQPTGPRAAIRQGAADALAATADGRLVDKLQTLLDESKTDAGLRQTVLWVLGRSGSQKAARLLIGQLDSEPEGVRKAAADALAELTGLNLGTGRAPWAAWWEQNRKLPRERWLEQRLAYQASRSRRLDGELEQTRSQLVRLQQQLYARLPAADRLAHIQSVAEQEQPGVRQLAVQWSAELLANAPASRDANAQRTLASVLLRLTHDSNAEVQRLAVLALGRLDDDGTFARLVALMARGRAPVRVAAARSLAQMARGSDPDALARRKKVVPLLQKALDDAALEVVVEAAEDLGTLGVPEAGPVLIGLLKRQSEDVRQTAAHALERVADPCIFDDLLKTMNDPSVAVRFGLVGAVGRAAGNGTALSEGQRGELLKKLLNLLQKDADPGVRSRAATVLGECGDPAVLLPLWERVRAGEDVRLREKAWAAFVQVIARAGTVELLKEWDEALAREKQPAWRMRLLTEIHARWQAGDNAKARFPETAPLLVVAKLQEKRWQAALPLLRELLARAEDPAGRERVLAWMLRAADQARRAGDAAQSRRLLEEIRPHLPRGGKLSQEYDRLANENG